MIRNLVFNIVGLPAASAEVRENGQGIVTLENLERTITDFFTQARVEAAANRLTAPVRFHYNTWATQGIRTYESLIPVRLNRYRNDIAALDQQPTNPNILKIGLALLKDRELSPENRNYLLSTLPCSELFVPFLEHILRGGGFTITTRKWTKCRLYTQRACFGVLSNSQTDWGGQEFKLTQTSCYEYFHITSTRHNYPLYRTNLLGTNEILGYPLAGQNHPDQKCFRLLPRITADGTDLYFILTTKSALSNYVEAGSDFEGRCRGILGTKETAEKRTSCHFVFKPS